MCSENEFENDYQKSSLLKVYLGRSKYGGGGEGRRRTVFVFGEFQSPLKKFRAGSSEKDFIWVF